MNTALTLQNNNTAVNLHTRRQATSSDTWKRSVLSEYMTEKGITDVPRDPREFNKYVDWLLAKGYKGTSINAMLVPVREAYRQRGIDTKKLIRGQRTPQGHLRDKLPDEDIRKLLAYADTVCSIRDKAIIYLTVYLGLREVELYRMDFDDFYHNGTDYFVRLQGKGRSCKDADMQVSNGLLNVMLKYIESIRYDREQGEPMFKGKKGHRMRPDVLSRLIAGFMRAAGVKHERTGLRISPHSLRHSAITKVIELTGDMRAAQQFARHTSIATTERYAHDKNRRAENIVSYEEGERSAP